MNIKQVLVVDAQEHVSAALQRLGAADSAFHCAFHCVKSVSDAGWLLSRQTCPVGLVVFDSPSPLTQDEVEPLIAAMPMMEWIAVVATEAMQSAAFRAFVLGAFHDFHSLPLDAQRLLVTLGHASGKASLRLGLKKPGSEASGRFGIGGNSPQMQAFFRQLEKVLGTSADLAVLIGGETGSGKELVAQAIHKNSKRASGPFIAVNCGAIPENLIQSELFGHEKGAFTGAAQRKIGYIEAADGGDLFLDEIGDLPLMAQVNLLRVLQTRVVNRLGSTRAIPVNFRIIAATHVDLQEAVRAERFRVDLYYRLNVLHLKLPPLRQRDGDVAVLAEAIFHSFIAGSSGHRARGFSAAALRAMSAHDWPGNVRELINRIHRAVALSDNALLSAADLGLEPRLETHASESPSATLESARISLDRAIVESSLRSNANNVTRAARQLGVSRVTLYRMMNKHSIAAIQ